MTTTLGLHQMTALDVDPFELVKLAADNHCGEVSLFVQRAGMQGDFPLLQATQTAAMRQRLQDSGVRLANIECFMLTPDTAIDDLRAALELGATLGARGATVIALDPEKQRLIEKLGRFCEYAGEGKLQVGIEFMPLMPIWNSLAQVSELILATEADNLGVSIDALHLVRSGASASDLGSLAVPIKCLQLCDSDSLEVTGDYAAEASGERLAPGRGRFPLQEILQAIPAGTPIELEVPQPPTRPAAERIRAIVDSTREQLSLAGLG